MSDNQKTQHEQLIAAGWRYDVTSDRYSAPGAATDGTARMYNVSAAWRAGWVGSSPIGSKEPE